MEKYKTLNMTEKKTDINITKIDKYKKIWTVLLPHNTKWQYWKTEQHFDEGTLNKTQLHFDESNSKHIQIQQRYNTRNTKKVNKNIQSTTNKYTLFLPVTEKSEECKTI